MHVLHFKHGFRTFMELTLVADDHTFLVLSNKNICSDPLWELITFILFLFSLSF